MMSWSFLYVDERLAFRLCLVLSGYLFKLGTWDWNDIGLVIPGSASKTKSRVLAACHAYRPDQPAQYIEKIIMDQRFGIGRCSCA